ncbi:hypothetical protein PLICRDRAFT_45187 [Plicaturopsis crispa FD-325 SS-3]|uniref:Peroxisomal enoyl-CoA-hydratase n=1 Tax=Plicaturopsis crispa FD-325 SS-3 TaxID=944288 RepID=A0A0C9SL91_PLICR|nr:hypothetical protein PLICRDRAFT_45187 [Plicaturopsis crispa FD-325 SS-3]
MASPDFSYGTLGFQDIIVTLDAGVATVLINRAKQRNTFGRVISSELLRVFELFDKDDRVRVVIMTAEPTAPAYCSGADISGGWGGLWKPESEKEGEHAHRDSGGVLTIAILRCRKITIAAVNGHAAGIGMTAMQLPFDLRFVWEGAKLTFPFVRRGIAPESAASFLLPRLLGHSRANSLLLTGEVVDPSSPHLQGLYHKIIPAREDVYPEALAYARELAAQTSQTAVAITKGLLQHPGATIEENHLLDSRALRILGGAGDAAEGARAFKERRPVAFADTLSKNLTSWYPWWTSIDIKHRQSKL